MRNARSSTHFAVKGNTSLTHRPHCPCRSNLNGDFNTLKPGELVTDSSFSLLPGSKALPSSSASFGFQSKVSAGLAPPFMKSWMMRLTFGAADLDSARPIKCARARPPSPPACHRNSRRFANIAPSRNKHELVAIQHNPAHVCHSELFRVGGKHFDLALCGRPAKRQIEQSAHLVWSGGTLPGQPPGQVLTLANHELVVEHGQRLQWRHRFGSNGSLLRGVGLIQGFQEWVRQRSEVEAINAPPVVCRVVDVEARVVDVRRHVDSGRLDELLDRWPAHLPVELAVDPQ